MVKDLTTNKIKHNIEGEIPLDIFNEFLKKNGIVAEGEIDRISIEYYGYHKVIIPIKISSIKEDRLKEIEHKEKK